MANLKEQEKWEDGVYQIEENDPVLGGENGITNKPIKQLANRTLWLKKTLELFGKKSAPKDLVADSTSTADESGHSHKLPVGSTTQKGIWQATSDTGLGSGGLVFTAKGAKKLAQIIANVQIAVSQKWTAKRATETEPGILPVSHKTDGTSKEKFASEYAVGEAAKYLQNKADLQHTHTTSDIIDFNTGVIQVVKNITRKNYEITIKGTSNWDNAKSKSIKVIGETVIYPDGKIEQYFYLESVRMSWFADEQAYGDVIKGKEILLQLWTAMPNKIDFVAGYISNAKNTRLSPRTTVAGEALEWYPIVWMFDKQQGLKDRFFMTTRRITGGADEYVDIFIKVEGY